MVTILAMIEPIARGEKIRRLREKLALTQTEVAVKAGVSLSYIQKLEAGDVPRPRFTTLRAVAGALGIEIGDLLIAGEPSIESLPDAADLAISPAALREISDAIREGRPPSAAAQAEWDRAEAKLKQVRREGKMNW